MVLAAQPSDSGFRVGRATFFFCSATQPLTCPPEFKHCLCLLVVSVLHECDEWLFRARREPRISLRDDVWPLVGVVLLPLASVAFSLCRSSGWRTRETDPLHRSTGWYGIPPLSLGCGCVFSSVRPELVRVGVAGCSTASGRRFVAGVFGCRPFIRLRSPGRPSLSVFF